MVVSRDWEVVVCYRCGQEAILLGVVLSQGGNPHSKEAHIRESRVPWGECPVPKGIIKGRYLYFV